MIAFARKLLKKLDLDIVRLRHSNSELPQHLSNIIAHHGIDCIIDVGANVGQYGEGLRALGFTGHIVSFEPVGSVFEQLRVRAANDPKWHCINLALGDMTEDKAINVYSSSVFSSFREANDYSKKIWNSLNTVETENVRVGRLDDIIDRIRTDTGCKTFMLKLDTQGFDLEAFRGAEATLASVPVLQSELSLIDIYSGLVPTYDVLREYNSKGYAISGMYPINREDKSMAVIEYDCVMVKREAQVSG